MGTKKLLLLRTHFDLFLKHLSNRVLYGNMIDFLVSLWVHVCTSLYFVFGLLTRYVSRNRLQEDDQKNNNHQALCLRQDVQIDSECSRIGSDIVQGVHGNDVNRDENENSDLVDTASAASTNKYKFMSEKHVNGYMEEPKAVNFTIQELFLGSTTSDTGVSTDDDFPGNDLETEAVHSEETEDAVEYFDTEEDVSLEKRGQETFTVHELQEFDEEEEDDDDDPVENFSVGNVTEKRELGILLAESELSEMGNLYPEIRFIGKHESLDELDSFSESHSPPSDAKPESISSIDPSPTRYEDVDSITYELSEGREDKKENKTIPNGESVAFSDDDYIELEPHTQNSIHLDPNALSGEDSYHKDLKEDLKETNSVSAPDDDQNDFGFQWDHDDLIEQLKLELRNVRTGGLPTILEEGEEVEESESPMVIQDLKLKPLKIDVKRDYKDRIEEILKVHRSYSEKMRKLDILNNQTMHAIGLLQLKDQVKSLTVQKPLLPIIMKNLWPRKAQRAVAMDDPMLEFCGKLSKELELVYVGQACLSWEILHWQNTKLQELQQCDAQGFHHYNLVASEFQLFEVLMHRFIEDESFQGPRVLNYVRNRCVLRSLLQIPVIRDDSGKDKRCGMEEEKDEISIEKLAKIVAESMHTFWEFVRKDETNTNLKAAQQTLVEPADSRLHIDVRKDFHKKEKKLKDIQRSGNCVVRKFQKQQEQDRLEHEMLVAQVEIRLISRVLSMSKLTSDQLMWCHQKLNHLNFDNRKVHLEPSFLLFPC